MPAENNPAIFDSSRSIEDFLRAAGARQPAPGGGAVSALAGALAASMGKMVANYSIPRNVTAPQVEQKFHLALEEFQRASDLLLQLMVEDQLAFSALSAARKNRDATFDAALLACIRVPQAVATTAMAMLDLCSTVAPIVNKFLLSDLAVCAELSMATVRCAGYNIRVNLADISDAGERERFARFAADLVQRATDRIQEVLPAIWSRTA